MVTVRPWGRRGFAGVRAAADLAGAATDQRVGVFVCAPEIDPEYLEEL